MRRTSTWRTLHAAHLTLELDGVDLVGRTAATVNGEVDGAEIADEVTPDAPVALAGITIAGQADAAAATITTDRTTVRALVLAAVERQFGVRATDVELAAPDRLILTAPGATLEGTFVVSAPDVLGLATPLGTVTVLQIDPENSTSPGFRVRHVGPSQDRCHVRRQRAAPRRLRTACRPARR